MKDEIRLAEIDKYNMWDILYLKVKRDQKRFLADNVWSLAQAYVSNKTEGAAYPFGIYNNKKPVGFILIDFNYPEVIDDPDAPEAFRDNYYIQRFMIDKRYQGRGYGKKAIQRAIEFVKTFPHGKADSLWVYYDEENTVVRKLFRSLGFEETYNETFGGYDAFIKL